MLKLSGLALLFCILSLPDQALFQRYNPDELLDFCLDAKYHKMKPGPEDDLHSQCAPWRNHSCCETQTTIDAHYKGLYNFDYSHCSVRGYMSEKCKKHFVQDLCFYECSPNIGPWVVSVEQSFRKERFMNVPLCHSDCNSWFQDCANDFTCTDNWARNFEWKQRVNHCPVGSSCKTFREIYETAENFCERVWDHSWKVVPDKEPCMRLWFDPSKGNPNEDVAKWRVNVMKRRRGYAVPTNANSAPKSHVYGYNYILGAIIAKVAIHRLFLS